MRTFHKTTFGLAAAALSVASAPAATAMIQCGTASWFDEGGVQAADGAQSILPRWWRRIGPSPSAPGCASRT